MKGLLSKIWVPALIVGIAAVQTFGFDPGRREALGLTKSLPPAKDTVVTHFDIRIKNDSSYLNSLEEKRISARDTIKAPDSLKFTDPFRYRYYVAIKDSLTHAQTRDSLKMAKDTISWHRLDSLYFQDSTETAKHSFQAWYNSLSKKEKRKYNYERMIPIKQHRADSILALKDSLKAIKDSIVEATPRILETFVLPDSLQYKRLFCWTHERYFHQITRNDVDTTFNYRFNDYPFMRNDVNASFLGVAGSPVQTYNFFKRTDQEGVPFYTALESWTYSPSTLPMFNSKTPYTELGYFGTLFANKDKEEDNLHIFTTQNITPALNVTLCYDRFGGGGMLDNETTRNKTFYAATNYLGKRYLMHAGYIYNMVDHDENGGLVDNSMIRDTTLDARELAVKLTDANNLVKKNTVFLDQEYRIPFTFIDKLKELKAVRADNAYRDSVMAVGDSTAIANMNDLLTKRKEERAKSLASADSVDAKITTAFIGHSTEYSTIRKVYTDKASITDSKANEYFNGNFFYNPSASMDSMRVMKLENRIFIKLQPWANDAIISKINGGIGNKIQSFYTFDPTYLYKTGNTTWNSTYIYAGAEGQVKDYFHWDALGDYTFLGDEINDFHIQGNLGLNFFPFRRARKSPVSFAAHFETNLKEPYFYEQHFFSNHYKWDNNFDKVSTTKITAHLDIPRWNMGIEAGYALLNNNIYYDTLGIVRQNTTPMSILTLGLTKNFTVFNVLHFDHRALFQVSSNDDVVPLPMIALNFRYYFQFNVVKDVLKMQLGVNALYTTKWYAPGYNIESGTFTNQRDDKYGNCPYLDAFVNMQWKRACIFVKLENAGLGWPMDKADYFSANHYIRPQRALKFGMYWPFYTQSGENASVGKAAGAVTGGNRSSSRNNNTTNTGMNTGGLMAQ
jgi:hypothetical protein